MRARSQAGGPGRGTRGAPVRRPGAAAACLLLACTLAVHGCGRRAPAPAAGADVLLITVDTLRADALGFAGAAGDPTPTLDRLAREGRVFTRARAHNVMTLPSHANILTGLYPYEHGVRDNSGFVLPAGPPTLATLLRDAGYSTAAFVSSFPLDSRFGLDRGFEVYDDGYTRGPGSTQFFLAERPGSQAVAGAMEWWRHHAERPRFLWLHLFEPHLPYEPPAPVAARFADRPYQGEVAAVDAYLEPLLEPLLAGDMRRPALVVFTSDHGEALGDHGEASHGLFAYEATLRVPLVLWGPGIEAGSDDRAAAHVDLLPTFLDALGLELEGREELPGRSLLGEPDGERDLYFEALTGSLNHGWAPLRGLVSDGLKFIDLPLPEIYDLEQDAAEARNLAPEAPERVAELRRRLPGESVWPPEKGEVSAEDEARLRSLGYLSGRARRKEAYGPEDDPKNLVELDRKLQEMVALYGDRRFEEAGRLAREILDERPETPLAHSMQVHLLLDQGRLGEAIQRMIEAREMGQASDALERQLALSLIEAGRPDQALGLLQPLVSAAAEETPGARLAPEDLTLFGVALSATGRQEEAAAALDRALALDGEDVRALEAAGIVALRRELYDEAESYLRRALTLNPALPQSWNMLGVALFSAGKEGALEAWRSCLALNPRQLDALFNLGAAAAELGRVDVARPALTDFIEKAPPERYAEDIEIARQTLARLDG